MQRSIHQVWFGPRPFPEAWTSTWCDAHPDWNYRLWREDDVAALGMQNARLWRELVERGIYDAASDVARIEILYRYGGIYVDCDSICRRPMDDAPFLAASFFATEEVQPNGRTFVTNAFMGAVAGSETAKRYIDRIGKARVRCAHGGEGAGFCCAWKTTGPLALTEVVRTADAMILPASAFFTKTITGEAIAGDGWGEHFWSSTTERSPAGMFQGRSYEEACA